MNQNPKTEGNLPSSRLCQLPKWGLILIEGPDAATFLQSQLTNSVLGLGRTISPQIAQSNASARLVGYCSPKGRLLASAWLGLFPVDKSSDDRFALFISKDIAASIAKRLGMYVLRSKVKVIDASNEWTVSGFISSSAQNVITLQEGQMGLRLPIVHAHHQAYDRVLIAQQNPSTDLDDNCQTQIPWNDLEVLSGIPRIVLATQEQFVPQMINFESVFGVDFKKGCYPGQEIVARSQYRGVIKRRLCLAHTTEDKVDFSLYAPGTEIFHSDDANQPAGMVVLSSPSFFTQNQIDLQIECKLDAIVSGEIRLGSPQGPVLKLDSLPYPLIEI